MCQTAREKGWGKEKQGCEEEDPSTDLQIRHIMELNENSVILFRINLLP